jgi:hypothetical protein
MSEDPIRPTQTFMCLTSVAFSGLTPRAGQTDWSDVGVDYKNKTISRPARMSPCTTADIPKVRSTYIDLEEGKEGIQQILEKQFRTFDGYSNINILWYAAQIELSMFLNDDAINSFDDLWQFVYQEFGHKYVMSRAPHIWQTHPSYPLNIRGLVIHFARQNGGSVTREQIDDYFYRIMIGSPINQSLISHDELLFCDKCKFMPTDFVNLTSERCKSITKALNELFSMENVPYIVLRDIKSEWFSCLPILPNGMEWKPLLLQEVLRIRKDIGYRVILPGLKGQNFDTVGAALVPNNSDIVTFADVVHRYCYAKYKLPRKIYAEDLRHELLDAYMIEGNELIYNMYKALNDHRFAFDSEKQYVTVLEN